MIHEDSHSVCSFSFTDQIYQISDKGGNKRQMSISQITPGPPVLISLSIRARAGQIGVTQVQKDGLNLKLIRMVWTGSSEGLSEPEAQKDGLNLKLRKMVWTGSSEGWSGPEAQKDGVDRKLRRMVLTGSSEGWCCPETLKGCSGPEVQNDGLDRKLNPVG